MMYYIGQGLKARVALSGPLGVVGVGGPESNISCGPSSEPHLCKHRKLNWPRARAEDYGGGGRRRASSRSVTAETREPLITAPTGLPYHSADKPQTRHTHSLHAKPPEEGLWHVHK